MQQVPFKQLKLILHRAVFFHTTVVKKIHSSTLNLVKNDISEKK
ncbi:hypothetical protein ADICYQ_5009 [Cyclobacterium qasimii M12-11B]|uniref:Uncharacterized protein n=1 Tax=Cyclobacterium qasimii M12-11B TaxID=641524 RepID=S7WGV0_9BACT|nr:hypothetical protein ADICYQ_5009 [Cyclobacterium qasimii M12-11B]